MNWIYNQEERRKKKNRKTRKENYICLLSPWKPKYFLLNSEFFLRFYANIGFHGKLNIIKWVTFYVTFCIMSGRNKLNEYFKEQIN